MMRSEGEAKKTMRTMSVIALLVSVGTTGCATQHASDQAVPPGVIYTTQAALGKCAFIKQDKDEKELILATIAATAISQGVNYLGEALTEAGKAKNWETTAFRNFEASNDTFPECIQVARGRFYTNPSKVHDDDPPKWWLEVTAARSGEPDRGAWNRERYELVASNNLWFASKPDFFFEGIFRHSSGKQALTVVPVVARLEQPIGTRLFRPDRGRQVALFASLVPPGDDPKLKTAPAVALTLGRIEPGQPRLFRTAKFDASGDESLPLEAAWFTFSPSDSMQPYTATVLVTEAELNSEFMTFLGKVFSEEATKTALSTGLQEMLLSERREAAKTSARQKEVTANNEADQEFAKAIEALRTCSTATDDVETSGANARKHMRDANLKRRAVDGDRAFVEKLISSIDLAAGPAAINQACRSVLSQALKI